MSRFVKRAVERLDLGDGDWVDLLVRLNYGHRAGINEALLKGAADFAAIGVAPPDVDLAAGNLELLRVAIIAWGGPGFCLQPEHPHVGDCEPAPITLDTIAELDQTAERILMELQRRMVPPATPDFTSASSPSMPMEPQAEPLRVASPNST